jgi:hypothetical protein
VARDRAVQRMQDLMAMIHDWYWKYIIPIGNQAWMS